jgi:hypothetical protein
MKTTKIKLKLLLASISLCLMFGLKAQTPNSVGIGTTNPNNSAILHLESSNQGFLMTRLNTSQISAITAPTVGLIVYNTTDQCYWYKRPTYWARLCNTDSINAQNVITNTFSADTSYINVNNFGNGYGDSIWVHYAQIDTAIINNLTVHTINADSIYLGGNSITTVITDSIRSLAWLLKGNSGTNPSVNFLGTIDNQPLVIRTNNTEKVRVTAPGNVGIGTPIPHSSALLELRGTDKGFLTTRLNTTQINAIVSPTIGLLTYNTDDNCYWYKHPFGWKRICNTDSLGNIFINTLTTNTINAQTINTSTIVAGTGTFTTITTNSLTTNIYNFGSGIGDSIWVHYAEIDTAYIHQLTVNTIKADSIYLGGNSITTVISDSITNMAWLLKGNLGTNPAINFLGTRDNQPLVIRTNNTEKLRVTSTGSVGIGTNAPTAKVDVIGNTKTTNFQMTSGATNGFVLRSDAVGSGSWTPLSALVSTLSPSTFNSNAWTILGNSATTPTLNFLGTTDNRDLTIRTNNTPIISVKSNSADEVIIGKAGNQITIGDGLSISGLGMKYIGFNLKRNGANFETDLFNFGNGSSFLYTLNDGEFGIGSTQSTGVSPNTFTDAQLTSNIRWRYTVNNQFLSVPTATNLNYNPTANVGAVPQISATGNESTGLFISDANKSNIGLRNKTNAFLINDENKNTIFHSFIAGTIYGSESVLTLTNSVGNTIFNNGTFVNSNDNHSFNANVLTNSSSNFLYTWARNFETGNSINNSDRVVAFGVFNTINNISESLIFGSGNTINGTSPGADKQIFVVGSSNQISKPSGMAIGYSNTVNHFGASCLGSNAPSFANNGVSIGAQGGMRVFSNNFNTTGVALAVGGGAWASISDRKLKENITEISNKNILEKIMAVPVTEWTYITQKVDTMNKYAPDGIHYDKAPIHIGPMAQDFSEVFGYGEFKDKITTSDIDGVMFSGIKALAEENKELKVKLETTLKEFEELKKIINELKNK